MTKEELENGIYQLVMTLCKQHEASGADAANAQTAVADWLEAVASSLRSLQQGETPPNGRSEE